MSKFEKRAYVIIILLFAVIAFNSSQLDKMQAGSINGRYVAGFSLPSGVPTIYGEELKISFDDVSPDDRYAADATIKIMSDIDKSLELDGANLERYINVLYTLENGMSCEYCCGARSVIVETGEAACGCAHSFAMRGLAKYLITEHGDEMTDEEIQAEVGKWKTLFFPNQIAAKASILSSQDVELNYINLASNKYRGIEKTAASSGSSSGGMVGGC